MPNNFLKFAPKGTYVMAKYDTATQNNIYKWAEENDIPRVLRKEQLHTTLMMSNAVEIPDWEEINQAIQGWSFKATSMVIQPTRIAKVSDGAVGGLLIFLEAPELVEFHDSLKKRGGKHTRADYEPHVTISYHVPLNTDLDTIALPKFDFVVDEVVAEPIDIDWINK